MKYGPIPQHNGRDVTLLLVRGEHPLTLVSFDGFDQKSVLKHINRADQGNENTGAEFHFTRKVCSCCVTPAVCLVLLPLQEAVRDCVGAAVPAAVRSGYLLPLPSLHRRLLRGRQVGVGQLRPGEESPPQHHGEPPPTPAAPPSQRTALSPVDSAVAAASSARPRLKPNSLNSKGMGPISRSLKISKSLSACWSLFGSLLVSFAEQ